MRWQRDQGPGMDDGGIETPARLQLDCIYRRAQEKRPGHEITKSCHVALGTLAVAVEIFGVTSVVDVCVYCSVCMHLAIDVV